MKLTSNMFGTEVQSRPFRTPKGCERSQYQGVALRSNLSALRAWRRRGGGGWTQIGVSQTASFTDTSALLVAGQPEQRDYRVQGMLNDARVGGVSGTVSAVTVP